MSSLTALHTDHTEQLILQSALEVLADESFSGLTVRAVARKAKMSERTIFRYFATREEFLDAVAQEFTRLLNMPPPPRTIADLVAMPRRLYTGFEPHAKLISAVFHTEIFPRMKAGAAQLRWVAIGKLLDREFKSASVGARKIAAANIRYFLSGATWHYYRFVFRFDLEETIACAETVIAQALDGLRAKPKSR